MVGFNSSPRRAKKRIRDVNKESPKRCNKVAKKEAPPKVLLNMEIADQIKQMFEAEGLVDPTPTNVFDILSNDAFDLVMKVLSREKYYTPLYFKYIEKSAEKRTKKGNKTVDLRTFFLRAFHKLRFVDSKFALYFERRIRDVPKIEIGLRIQKKPEGSKDAANDDTKEAKVLFNIHHGIGIISPTACDVLSNIDHVLRFARITKHLTVFGLPLNDLLLESLKKIDTSAVTVVHLADIPSVEFEGDLKQKAKELVLLFPAAKVVEFNGVGFDYEVVFGDVLREDGDLERVDEILSGAQLAAKCVAHLSNATTVKGLRKARRKESHQKNIAIRLTMDKLGVSFAKYDVADFDDNVSEPEPHDAANEDGSDRTSSDDDSDDAAESDDDMEEPARFDEPGEEW